MADAKQLQINTVVAAEIFRAYDIRGIVGQSLSPDVAFALGAAIGSEAKDQGQNAVIIGRDGRHSSPELAQSLAQGIQATGMDVIDVGMVPTPVLYYATKILQSQSGVMVTGSHNPPDYNGFKIVIADQTLAQERIQQLRQRIENNQLHAGEGQYQSMDIGQDYINRILGDIQIKRPLKVVMDSGNGVAGPLASQLLEGLGCHLTPLFTGVDGDFPNHHPDPSNPENLKDLVNMVAEQRADLGLAFDGDGDRLGVVTRSGKVIWPDRMLMLYAKDILNREPGATILHDVKCSGDVALQVQAMGGNPIMCATGHSLVKAQMKQTGAAIGGELSGHIFFKERWYGFDDALYSAARLLEILSQDERPPEQVFADFPEKVSTPELHVKVREDNKFEIIKNLQSQGQFPGGKLVNVDGVRVDFPNSWGLLRASNTTPVLVARFEGDTEADLDDVKLQFRQQLLAVEPTLDIPF